VFKNNTFKAEAKAKATDFCPRVVLKIESRTVLKDHNIPFFRRAFPMTGLGRLSRDAAPAPAHAPRRFLAKFKQEGLAVASIARDMLLLR